MSKTCAVSLITLFLSACTSMPAFQKNASGTAGYTIQDLASKDNFRVTVQLPSETSEKYLRNYGFRAVGEECAARGFQFFDVGELNSTTFEGFCFSDSNRKSLAITFHKSGLAESPRRFIVEDLNSKSITRLQAGDEILSVADKNPTSVTDLKSVVFVASSNKQVSLPLKIKRQGKELTVAEPIADLKNGAFGKSDLEALRRLVR